jgi:ATP-binding cassette subfamily B protein
MRIEEMNMILAAKAYNEQDYVKIPFRTSAVYTILIILDSILNAILPSLQILATASFVDTAVDILNNGGKDRIYLPLLMLMLLVSYSWVSKMLIGFVNTRMKMRLGEEFRTAVTEKRSKLEYRHIENNETWDLISRAAKDPQDRIFNGFSILLRMANMVIGIVSILLVLATQVWWAALAIIAFSVPLFFVSLKSGKLDYEAFKEANKHTRRADYLQTVLSGRDNVEERSLFRYTQKISDKWYERYESARKITTRASAINFVRMKGSSIIVILICILIAGVLLIPLNSKLITIGMFMGLVNASFSLVQMMSWELSYVTREIANNKEYLKDLSAFSKLEETQGAADLPDKAMGGLQLKSIEFKDVKFQYPGTDIYILNGLSFYMAGDRHYAFVGVNGAGKTTITKLLTGLYPEFEGEILINGKSIREFSASQLKGLFSVVYQDFAKYYITLRDNIALGNVNGARDDEVAAALAVIDLTDEVSKLEKGLDTPLGKILEGGTDFSGGEWQRVAIARSLVSKAPVHILDEPTAALDPVAESKVYELFGRISKDKMTIFITHRLGAAKLADEILVLKDGKIAEQGSHDRLMEENGIYAEMFEAQRSWYN